MAENMLPIISNLTSQNWIVLYLGVYRGNSKKSTVFSAKTKLNFHKKNKFDEPVIR